MNILTVLEELFSVDIIVHHSALPVNYLPQELELLSSHSNPAHVSNPSKTKISSMQKIKIKIKCRSEWKIPVLAELCRTL